MFRQEAIDHQKKRWRGRALLLPGIPFWVTASLCIFFITTFLTFITVANYTRRINVSGEISTYPRVSNFYSSVQGVIVKEFVTEGQVIKKGDPIYQIDVSKSTSSGVVSENQRRDIDGQLDRISQIISRLESNKKDTVEMLEKQKVKYNEALQRSTSILARSEQGTGIMKNNMENYLQYQIKGLINKDQLSNQVAIYYQQQNNLLNLTAINEQNSLQVIALESQVRTRSSEFDNQIYQMELQRYELKKELLDIDARGTIIVRALVDGRIDSLSVTIGQMVNVGDSLLQVVPPSINYYSLILWVPNDAIPYISIGDLVNIRYEAFPAEKFGQFAGKVLVVSKSPASPQEMMTYQGAPKAALNSAVPYYKIIVRPEVQTISYNSKTLRIESGMKAESTLFLEKRKIYQWMFSPFYDMKFSALGPVHE